VTPQVLWEEPHTLLREAGWVRVAGRAIEVFHHGKRVPAHMRSSSNRRATGAMPTGRRSGSIRQQVGEIGRNTAALIEIIMRGRSYPEQSFRPSVGIIRLVKSYSRDRPEAACAGRWRSARAPSTPSTRSRRTTWKPNRPQGRGRTHVRWQLAV
jgi:hypothetical protein